MIDAGANGLLRNARQDGKLLPAGDELAALDLNPLEMAVLDVRLQEQMNEQADHLGPGMPAPVKQSVVYLYPPCHNLYLSLFV